MTPGPILMPKSVSDECTPARPAAIIAEAGPQATARDAVAADSVSDVIQLVNPRPSRTDHNEESKL